MADPTLIQALRDPEFYKDVGRRLLDVGNRGIIGGALGAPVDVANMALGALGVPVSTKPVGGSEWIGEKMQKAGVVSGERNPVAETLAGFVDPATAGTAGMKLAGLGASKLGLMAPALVGGLKSPFKQGGPEFGKWELQRVERRLRPEEYIDASGENRTKYVADMENAEISHGSGQPTANIYWMKNKETGETMPFGSDSAYAAMGMQSKSAAEKQFGQMYEQQMNDWFANKMQEFGQRPTDQKAARIREWLIKGQITPQNAEERIAKVFNIDRNAVPTGQVPWNTK